MWEHLLRPLKRYATLNRIHLITDHLQITMLYMPNGIIPSHIINAFLQYYSTDTMAPTLQTIFYNALYHMHTAIYTFYGHLTASKLLLGKNFNTLLKTQKKPMIGPENNKDNKTYQITNRLIIL